MEGYRPNGPTAQDGGSAAVLNAAQVGLLVDALGAAWTAGLFDDWNDRSRDDIQDVKNLLRETWNALPQSIREEAESV